MSHGQALMAETYKASTGIAKRKPEEKELRSRFFRLALELLDEGKILPSPVEIREGLEGALSGIEDLRKGSISGRKIISRLVRDSVRAW